MPNLQARQKRTAGLVWVLMASLAIPTAVVAADDPAALTDLMAKGKLAADLGRHDEAVAAFAAVADAPKVSDPMRAEALVRLGAARRSAGDDEGALHAFERAWSDHASRDPQALAVLVLTVGGALPGQARWAQIWQRVALTADRSDPAHPVLTVTWPDVPRPARRAYSGQPVTLDLKDGKLSDIFRLYADMTGLNVVVNPGVRGEITIKVKDMPWDDALDRILTPNGLVARHQGNVLWIAPPEQLGPARTFAGRPIEVDVNDRDLVALLSSIARNGGATVAADPSVAGKVTLKLAGVPWDQAFDIVAGVNGLDWTRDGGVIRVTPRSRQ
jgi:hypothetical protein